MNPLPPTPVNRREHAALQALIALLGMQCPMSVALAQASNNGIDIDMARLQDLWDNLDKP